MRIVPWEAQRIAEHLRELPETRREGLDERLRRAVRRWSLASTRGREVRYTCAFLEPDLSCALPLHRKPVACLSFNPLDPDTCDQEPEWFRRAGDEVERCNSAAGLPARKEPIPWAVLAALEAPSHGAAARAGRDASPGSHRVRPRRRRGR